MDGKLVTSNLADSPSALRVVRGHAWYRLSPMLPLIVVSLLSFTDFNAWKVHHGRQYASSSHEDAARAIWHDNLAASVAHNERAKRGEIPFTISVRGPFADLTNEEYVARVLRPLRRPRREAVGRSSAAQLPKRSADELPKSWSWYDQGVITDVKNQGSCGSCWAFSAVAAIESAVNLAVNQSKRPLPSECKTTCGNESIGRQPCCTFSDQQVADCTNDGADTCDYGGEPHDGVMNIVQGGGLAATSAEYPYTSGTTGHLGRCRSAKPSWVATNVTGYVNVSHGDEAALLEASALVGAISVGIDASSFLFQLYDSGVYLDPTCGNGDDDLDHAVTIVGFGEGPVGPPRPPPSPPGPADCKDNHYQQPCEAEEGCHWCSDSHISWCQRSACNGLDDEVRGSERTSISEYTSVSERSGERSPRRPSASAHAMLGLEWWQVKNSWGKDWGMDGYIAMGRNRNNQCGVATDAIYVTLPDATA